MIRATILALLVVLFPSSATAADEVEVVWVSPDGDNTNDGRTRATPLASLQAANAHLCELVEGDCGNGLGRDVQVRMEPGTYQDTAAETVWTYSDPEHETMIVPADWDDSWGSADVTAHGGYPVMDGEHQAGGGLWALNTRNLFVYYIKWYRYVDIGIYLQDASDSFIYGNVFERFGTYYRSTDSMTYSGITLHGADDNTIRNNVFKNILNDVHYGHEHGVYLAHDADRNQVLNNSFTNIGGDPVRVRDGSDSNTVTGNRFELAGTNGYIGDWYDKADESKSWSNVFRGNVLKGRHPWGKGRVWADRFCHDTWKMCPTNRVTT